MTEGLRDYLIETYKLSKKIKNSFFELTYPREIAAYEAGYEQAKKDLSCVQQRLNMLEEHNMTIDDVITCLEKHNEIHSRQEPRAYYITKALNIAIDFLKLISELKNAYSRFGDACNNDEETKYWYEICALLEKIK
jgi:hypothetical protein